VKRIIAILTTAIAMSVGWITLITYFLPQGDLVRVVLVELAVIVAGFAMFLGALNVLMVHLTRLSRGQSGRFYSFVLVASFLVVLVVSAIEGGNAFLRRFTTDQVVQEGIAGTVMAATYQYVLIPLQSSLAALLPFVLAFAAYRTLRMRTASSRAGAVIFLITAIIVLLGQVPLNLPVYGPAISSLREWVVRVGAMAGMRGILLGVAIGITAVALRVLIGADRPTSD
jgi:hypothetical protein